MNAASQASRSLWMLGGLPGIGHDAPGSLPSRTDIVVVGAGIAGLSAAYELASAGNAVVVLDRGAIAGGMTARTTAHLASELDDYYHRLIKVRGKDEARRYHLAQQAAIDRIEHIHSAESIDCDFARVDGYLFAAQRDDRALLEQEARACGELGVDATWQDAVPAVGGEGGPALRFPGQARFHPLNYAAGLVRCIVRAGGRIFADTAVTAIEESATDVVVTLERGGTLRAGAAVVATNAPFNNRLTPHTKQAPYRTYVVAGRVARGSVPDALYWDTLDPYHYVRLQPADDAHDWLIVGGEDHKTGTAHDASARLARLAAWAGRFAAFAPEHRWSGQVMEPVDYLPFAGVNPGNRNVYVVTGDSGQGMTNGVAAALLIRGLVLGEPVAWTDPLDPKRITVGTTRTFVTENMTAITSMAGHVTAGEIASADELAPGHGGILRQGMHKLAVSRDADGVVHACSATCTHVGCVVAWNDFEKCWDCPCHGSQFSPQGEVLNGPAIGPLEPAKLEDNRRTSSG